MYTVDAIIGVKYATEKELVKVTSVKLISEEQDMQVKKYAYSIFKQYKYLTRIQKVYQKLPK